MTKKVEKQVAVAVVGDTVIVFRPGDAGADAADRVIYYSLRGRKAVRAAVDEYLRTRDSVLFVEALDELGKHPMDTAEAKAMGVSYFAGVYYVDEMMITPEELKLVEAAVERSCELRGGIRLCRRLRACVDPHNPGLTAERVNALRLALASSASEVHDSGDLVMYKVVDSDGWSSQGNTSIRVISGQTDERGRIFNAPGAVIEIDESQICRDPKVECGPGLHLALDNKYGSGRRLRARVCPEDLACYPNAGWQIRVRRYAVLHGETLS